MASTSMTDLKATRMRRSASARVLVLVCVSVIVPFLTSRPRAALGQPAVHAAYVAYATEDFSTLPFSAALVGARGGWEGRWRDRRLGAFVEAAYLVAPSATFDLMLISGGGRCALVRTGWLEVGAQGAIDVEHADLDRFRNVNVLVGFGAGVYAEARVHPRVSLMLAVAARGFLDVTPPTRCNDGSSWQSTGSGTCSWHGGIDFYTDKLGEGTAMGGLVGLRVWFGAHARH